MMQAIVLFLIALSGILGGYALSRIAPEEIKPGKTYFFILTRSILVILFLTISYYLFVSQKYVLLFSFVSLALILLILSLKREHIWLYAVTYLLLGSFYFLHLEQSYNLIVASLLFVYGLPVGTLLSTSDHEN